MEFSLIAISRPIKNAHTTNANGSRPYRRIPTGNQISFLLKGGLQCVAGAG